MASSKDDFTGSFADRITEQLKQKATTVRSISEERLAYRKAAALVTTFDPEQLLVEDESNDSPAYPLLSRDTVTVGPIGDEPTRMRLRSDVRRSALAQIDGPREALSIIGKLAESEHSQVTRTMHSYLRGKTKDLGDQTLDELDSTLTAVRWLSRIKGMKNLPEIEAVQRIQSQRRLLAPFHSLVGDKFYGRNEELDTLRKFVGVLPSESYGLSDVLRDVRYLFSVEERPLLIHGPGGIGKSTLIAKFIIDHASLPIEKRFPFAYIDLERPTLTIAAPMTIFQEVCRQLSVQFLEVDDDFRKLRSKFEREGKHQRRDDDELSELLRTSRRGSSAHLRRSSELTRDCAAREKRLFGQLASITRNGCRSREANSKGETEDFPLLIVVDSFEEAQFRSSPYIARMWRVLDSLQAAYPMLRVVVSGRAPVAGLSIFRRRKPQVMKLGALDEEAAVEFLSDKGVPSHYVDDLVRRFGGNPLSLRLVTRLASQDKESRSWISDVDIGSFWRRVDETKIQGQLYTRVLNHIHDPDVRKLAHPGMVLRRITPGIIKNVLALHCNVDVPDIETANRLFESLSREVDLVENEGSRSLRHRPDVRAITLSLMEIDRNVDLKSIEQAAVAYYEKLTTPRDRAEEIYHRLRLGEPPRSVERRWMDGLDSFLESALDGEELSGDAQSFLAQKIGNRNVSDKATKEADLEDWEQLVAQEAVDLLDQGKAKETLDLFGQRDRRTPDSRLFALEFEALRRLNRDKVAYEEAQLAITKLNKAGARSVELDLQILVADLVAENPKLGDPIRHLERAEKLALGEKQPIDVIAVEVKLIKHLRVTNQINRIDAVRERLAENFASTPVEELRLVPNLADDVATELGQHEGVVMAKAIEVFGFRGISDSTLENIGGALVRQFSESPNFREWVSTVSRALGFGHTPDATRIASLVKKMNEDGKLAAFAARLAREIGTNPILELLQATLKDVLAIRSNQLRIEAETDLQAPVDLISRDESDYKLEGGG